MGNELAACNESAPRLLGRESTLQGGLQAAEKGAAEADKMAFRDSDSDDGFYVPYWRKKKPECAATRSYGKYLGFLIEPGVDHQEAEEEVASMTGSNKPSTETENGQDRMMMMMMRWIVSL